MQRLWDFVTFQIHFFLFLFHFEDKMFKKSKEKEKKKKKKKGFNDNSRIEDTQRKRELYRLFV